MEDKMDSEQSNSGESSSSTSDSSTETSDSEEEVMESIRVLGQDLELPQDLCEDYSLFTEFFSMNTWDSLEENHKKILLELLPKFPENDDEEKQTTIKMLFNHEPFHFTSPLTCFFRNLRQGNYRPDIARMRKFLMKARAKQQRRKIKSYYAKLLPEVLISRERLLAVAKSTPPGFIPSLPLLPPKPATKNNYKPIYVRARHRYFEELTAIWSEVGCQESDDENYPEGPPEHFMKKRKRTTTLQGIDNSISGTLNSGDISQPSSLACLKNVLSTHRSRRQYRENHPELNTTGITLEDIKQRVALVNEPRKAMFGCAKTDLPAQKQKKGVKRDINQKLKKNKMPVKNVKDEDNDEKLLPHIKIKCEQVSDSENSSIFDPMNSPRQFKKMECDEIKEEVTDYDVKFGDSKEFVIKKEPQDCLTSLQNNSRINQPVPIKLEDLDGIDMMALPVEIADESGEVLVDSSTEVCDEDEALTETTHANFLSLVRALFPAKAAHRATKQELHARCMAVMRSPIAPLNTWYHLSDDWCMELNSALDFLAGERGPHPDDYVPYLQYLPETQTYQWIGAGRDCDAILGRLCERWLRAASPPAPTVEPPPPRYPTNWVIRQPTNSEIAEFRSQERKRFASASKPFTYVQYGYRAVVGPAGAARAAAGLLVSCPRPRAVSLAALLRDAVARLPNGEGTQRDILTLLKMSQWIVPNNDQTLTAAVSSALDRLAAVKRDPIVKYEHRTATWIFLHRNRSEEDWLKTSSAKSRNNKIQPTEAHSQTTHNTSVVFNNTDSEVPAVDEVLENASDSDVDVDDTSTTTAGTALSSAQLLMQATQAVQNKQLIPKPKARLVPTPLKQKAISKQTPNKINLTQNKQNNVKINHNKAIAQPKSSILAKTKQNVKNVAPKCNIKQSVPSPTTLIESPKHRTHSPKQSAPSPNTPVPPVKQTVQTVKQTVQTVKQTVQTVKQTVQTVKQTVQTVKPSVPSPQTIVPKPKTIQTPKVNVIQNVNSNIVMSDLTSKQPSSVGVVVAQQPPLTKQKSVVKTDASVVLSTHNVLSHQTTPVLVSSLLQGNAVSSLQQSSILQTAKVVTNPRRGVVRVLSPANSTSGKSLISPRALMPQAIAATNTKRSSLPASSTVSTLSVAQSSAGLTNISSSQGVVTSSVTTRTVQISGGRTVQLSNQTVQLATGQSVQLSGHTLQLSSLQLPTHSVRLPSGQTVQLASPQTVQAIRAATQKSQTPRPQTQSIRPLTQIPVSTVQLAGQTVQIAGQTVQLAGQSVQLTGHTVKLPSGQSVQVASQSVLPTQSVQLPSGQTVQLASGNVQTVLSGQNVQLGNQSVQLGSQTVQIGNQTVQLAGGQTVQLPSGQTLQLSSGQTIQLASGQTLQLGNQTPKSMAQVVRTSSGEKTTQPIVAKLLTNAQGQVMSVERRGRPVLLAGKPLTNIILQQSDGGSVRGAGSHTPQTIVISNMASQSATTSSTSAPILKLQQVNPIHQVKVPQGTKIQQGAASTSVAPPGGVRSVLMGGRHVLARLWRPSNQQP
ncbi:nuclear factor related to kappa-B-binding protein isoform X2 [Leptidea sinapis]|uniref:nuclear factor related to kappa-B-binding protein isoform X2 n=1 Tax=Leptidea sinapis TaxID=189913 RepID=UPI002123A329|nr:nuclear factor related to kappa-B-binding protein isoform X2 [Leptidea sinapis]